jgi:hypothetical protein
MRRRQAMVTIDLSEQDGNAFALMGHAKNFARQMGLDGDEIVYEMRQGDYEDLVDVFKRYFDGVVEVIDHEEDEWE